MKPVKLSYIASTIEALMDENNYYLNLETGEIVEYEDSYLHTFEESEPGSDFNEYNDWEQETLKLVEDIYMNDEKYCSLPQKYEIHEYRILKEFCYGIEDEALNELFTNAIHGRGAFSRFKDLAFKYNLLDDWYDFRWKKYVEIAQEWCEDNDIPYIEDNKLR